MTRKINPKNKKGKKFKLEFEITEVGDNGVVDEYEFFYTIKCKNHKDVFGDDFQLFVPIKNLDKFLKKKQKKSAWQNVGKASTVLLREG